MPQSVSGYVLAGGRSTRMGRAKALLPWKGSTLGTFVARQVLQAAGNVTVVGAPDVDGFRTIPDLFPGFGPVGGIVTALEDSRTEWSLIVACDMPGLTVDWLRELLKSAEPPAVIPRTVDGRLHPLCAVWRRAAVLQVLRTAVDAGVHTVREAIRPLPYRILETGDPALVANVNTPEEWARFREQA